MRDYPQSIAETDRVEPVPRRIRAMLAGRVVLDTVSALYVWEWSNYPQYYIPFADVDAECLVDEQHEQRLKRGLTQRYGLTVGEVSRPKALRMYTESTDRSPDRNGALRVGRARQLVRRRRRGVRPPAQPVHARRRAAIDTDCSHRARRRGARGVVLAGDVLRDRPADALLLQPHRGELRPPRRDRHCQFVSVQGDDERLLVGRASATRRARTSRGRTTSRRASCFRSRD